MKVLVIGGRSDIGQAIITHRLALNDSVYFTVTSQDSLSEISSHIKVNATPIEFDLKHPEDSAENFKSILKAGAFDGVVLNAAMPTQSYKKLFEYSSNEVNEAVHPHLFGYFNLLQLIVPKMAENEFGRLVFVSSQSVLGFHKHGLYSGWKSLWEGFFKSIAVDYGDRNITANIVRPGLVETKRTSRFWKLKAFRDIMIPLIPQNRFGKPEDVAIAVDYFLSKDCYSNGTVLEVSGGLPSTRSDKLFVNPF